ncbi:cytochrome P450 [Mycolicibacterium sp. P9-64]|uniref:cytochrome P450 n=1 Tax=Mycolicibacterium sp. P9-64 TaxID=2024612 RepID=UPI0015648742|nr:cytochrome P450 [Mycolicibacterium sp. P9-64]
MSTTHERDANVPGGRPLMSRGGAGGVDVGGGHRLAAGGGTLSAYEYLPWDDPEFERDPYPWFARAQAEVPVLRDTDGTIVVLRYDDILEYGKRPTMSVEPNWEKAGPWSIARQSVIAQDPPKHTQLRRQTSRWFTPKIVRDWVTTTAAVTNEILDGATGDVVDGWWDLSAVPTHRTMCRILQFADDDVIGVVHDMADTMPMLSALPREGTIEQAAGGFNRLARRVTPMLDAKHHTPGDGLADALLAAHRRGEITEEEARATTLLLYSLGHMDVGYAIAAGLHIFARLPEVWDDFRTDPSVRDAIINEIIRYDPPELSFYRVPTEDVTIRGVDIPAGSTVRFVIAAANRDPEIFADPHRFDHGRPQERSHNLSFGLGPHSCLGQVISRAEARTVFEVLAARFRRLELTGPVQMDNTDFSRHFTAMPLRLVR